MKNKYIISILIFILHIVVVAVIGYFAIGWQDMHGMDHGSGVPMPTATEGAADSNPVVKAYQEANARMHGAMSVPGTGDADRDFATGMIAHHQGAIDMANILLQYGRDPQLRAMAEDVIEVQQKEIEFLQRWLVEHPE